MPVLFINAHSSHAAAIELPILAAKCSSWPCPARLIEYSLPIGKTGFNLGPVVSRQKDAYSLDMYGV